MNVSYGSFECISMGSEVLFMYGPDALIYRMQWSTLSNVYRTTTIKHLHDIIKYI